MTGKCAVYRHVFCATVRFCRAGLPGPLRFGREWYPFTQEETDGHATIEWIGRQQWCNGAIGIRLIVQCLDPMDGRASEEPLSEGAMPSFMTDDCWKRCSIQAGVRLGVAVKWGLPPPWKPAILAAAFDDKTCSVIFR